MSNLKIMSIALKVMFAIFLSLVISDGGDAQDAVKVQPGQTDLDLGAQIKALQMQQQQILSNLNEIKQLLATNVAMRPGSQPPALPSKLETGEEAFRGESGATVAIIEYADFECPFCGQYEHQVYPQISKDYVQTGKVKYFFRDLPLPMHPRAMGAARAAHCDAGQGKGTRPRHSEILRVPFKRPIYRRDQTKRSRRSEIGHRRHAHILYWRGRSERRCHKP